MIFSVLYFNGEWKDHFHEDAVVNEKFYIDENKIVETQLMYRRGDYYMMQDTNIGASMLKLPYVGDQVSCLILAIYFF